MLLHYGRPVFERRFAATAQPQGAAIFRLPNTCNAVVQPELSMPLPYSLEQLSSAVVGLVESMVSLRATFADRARGYGEMGLALRAPDEVFIANYSWGKYVAGGGRGWCASPRGAGWLQYDACTGDRPGELSEFPADPAWRRIAMGFRKGCARLFGKLSRRSGENLFVVPEWCSLHHALANSCCRGLRVIRGDMARHMGIPVVEQAMLGVCLYRR